MEINEQNRLNKEEISLKEDEECNVEEVAVK